MGHAFDAIIFSRIFIIGGMSVYDQVLSFIAHPDTARFEPLALEVFGYQFALVPAYRDYCLSIGVGPDSPTSIDDIPAVSTLAFKYAELAPSTVPEGALTFLTSGTTIGTSVRGRHVVPRPAAYRASALAHLGRMLFPDRVPMRILALHPTAERMPESSLSRMITWSIEEFASGQASLCAATRTSIDPAAAYSFMREAQSQDAPVCILGTTASFAALFDHLECATGPIRLASGSRIMDTGGAKGQRAPLDAAEVCARAERLLGIDPAFAINEYGMTELCSQMYDATSFNSADAGALPNDRTKVAPPWMRVAAVDPVTLRPVSSGEIGLLRFFDLANVGSVSAVMTEDFGSVEGDRVRVLGRAGNAEPRGCALAIRQFEAAEQQRR